jgi:hypothetical protein
MQTLPTDVIDFERELLEPVKGRKGAELVLTWEDDKWQLVWCDGGQSYTVEGDDLFAILEAKRNY